jgi:hypothetical protein
MFAVKCKLFLFACALATLLAIPAEAFEAHENCPDSFGIAYQAGSTICCRAAYEADLWQQ